MINVGRVEAGGRGGAQQRRWTCCSFKAVELVHGCVRARFFSPFGQLLLQFPLCLLQELLHPILHLRRQLLGWFVCFFLQAIFSLFPDGRLRAAFLPDQHASGCSSLLPFQPGLLSVSTRLNSFKLKADFLGGCCVT